MLAKQFSRNVQTILPEYNVVFTDCNIDLYLVTQQRGPGKFSRNSDWLLRAGRSGDRIPVGARISAPVQTDPEAHPASYTMGSGSFPGVKRPGRDADHAPHFQPRFKKE
jgi:hypothetical protein